MPCVIELIEGYGLELYSERGAWSGEGKQYKDFGLSLSDSSY